MPPATPNGPTGALRTRRLVIGFGVLLFVDFLWVSSSELTRYIFEGEQFHRPFFTAYMKTCMFMLYLLGFLFHRPWRDQCLQIAHTDDEFEEIEFEELSSSLTPSLSDPTFEPSNIGSDSERSSIQSDSDHLVQLNTFEAPPPDPEPDSRNVRFARVHEIRHMPACEAKEAKLSRLPYELWLRAARFAHRHQNRVPIRYVASLSLQFCIIWFIANYGYQAALNDTDAGIVNVLSSSSSFFTLILAGIFPSTTGDRFTLSKFLLVTFSLSGVACVVYYDSSQVELTFPAGAFWALLGSVGYALYLVMLRRKVDSEDKLDIPMFFGFVGLFCLLFMWPGLYLLHATSLEPFYPLPNKTQFAYIAVNGLIGTVLSEYLWLWGCFLTNSLIATLALSLTIPMTVIADNILWKETYPWVFFAGAAPIVLSFVGVTLLAHYDNCDPVAWLLRRVWQRSCAVFGRCCRRFLPVGVGGSLAGSVRLRDRDTEQAESLMLSLQHNEDHEL